MRYVRVGTVDEILGAVREDGAALLAGGTDLLVKMRGGLVAPKLLVDVSEVETLRGISESAGRIEIGAATPEWEILASGLVREKLPLLTSVLRVLGSVQIRSRGTLGGNLANASPAADSAVPLLLYDAELALIGDAGERVLPAEAFLLGPGRTALRAGEIVRAIRVPIPTKRFLPFFHKVGKRRALTIAIASVGALVRIEGTQILEARLAAGSVAPVPLRLRAAEDVLRGSGPTEDLVAEAARAAAAAVSPISDVRASADYRRAVVADLVARALRSAPS